MSDEPPTPDKKPPLDYWQPSARPLNPVLRALCVLSGLAVGTVLMGIVGTMLMAAVSSTVKTGNHSGRLPLIVGGILSAACFVWLCIYQYHGRRLSLEQQLRGPRYFAAGILLGCCLTILLQGLCFSAMS